MHAKRDEDSEYVLKEELSGHCWWVRCDWQKKNRQKMKRQKITPKYLA